MGSIVVRAVKGLLIHTPLSGFVFPRYRFWLSPPQLCFLCQCIEATKDVDGGICEIGCATGWTTVFLNKYMDAQKIEKPYMAIDTFSGFVTDDIEFEVAHRGKSAALYRGFANNKKTRFDKTMQKSNIARVRSIEADVNEFDLKTIGPISFALLDVDLYRPMRKSLHDLYAVLSSGGVIVADDCDAARLAWDGADQAYKEFVKQIGQTPEIVCGKFGVIRKPTRY